MARLTLALTGLTRKLLIQPCCLKLGMLWPCWQFLRQYNAHRGDNALMLFFGCASLAAAAICTAAIDVLLLSHGADLLVTLLPFLPLADSQAAEWLLWGGDLSNTRSATTALINRTSVANGLFTIWERNLTGAISASPFVGRSQVVLPTWAGLLFSLDPYTGGTQWQRNISEYTTSNGCVRPAGATTATGARSLSRTTPALIEGADLIVLGTRPEDSYFPYGLPYILGESEQDCIADSGHAGLCQDSRH